jgi:hypothetical protein
VAPLGHRAALPARRRRRSMRATSLRAECKVMQSSTRYSREAPLRHIRASAGAYVRSATCRSVSARGPSRPASPSRSRLAASGGRRHARRCGGYLYVVRQISAARSAAEPRSATRDEHVLGTPPCHHPIHCERQGGSHHLPSPAESRMIANQDRSRTPIGRRRRVRSPLTRESHALPLRAARGDVVCSVGGVAVDAVDHGG